jgi:hypothetical protein
MHRKIIFSLCLATALTACTTESVMRPDVDVGMQTSAMVRPAPISQASDFSGSSLAADEALSQSQPLQDPIVEGPIGRDTLIEEPTRPSSIAVGFSRLVNPFGLGSSQDAGMPAAEASCRKQLRKLGVTFQDLPPINDGGSCQIPYPVKISGLPGRAALKPAATLNCEMALSVAQWVKSELQPAARVRYWSSVGTITQASSYSCRNMVGTATNKISEHAKGNALDISKIELKNGKDILVRKKGFFAFRERGLLNTVRADGCSYFNTVLGPGYNKAHADHFHFDIMERKNGYRACK